MISTHWMEGSPGSTAKWEKVRCGAVLAMLFARREGENIIRILLYLQKAMPEG